MQETNENELPLELVDYIFTYSDPKTLQSWLLVNKFFNRRAIRKMFQLLVQKYFPETYEASKSENADWSAIFRRCLESKFQQDGMSFIYQLIQEGRLFDIALLANGIAKEKILSELCSPCKSKLCIEYAIECGQLKIVQLFMSLLKNNVPASKLIKLPLWTETNTYGEEHFGILSYAAMLSNEEITIFLLEFVLQSDIHYLMKHNTSWNDFPFDLVHIAAGKNRRSLLIAIIETLKKWENGQEVLGKLLRQTTYDKKTPFTCAALFGHYEILDILFEADPVTARRALSNVIVSMDEIPFSSLRRKYFPSGSVHMAGSRITYAEEDLYPFNYKDVFHMLIKRGADINAADERGKTALHYAIERYASSSFKKINNLELINFLLENGADINAKDVNGETPLYYFVRMTHTHSSFFSDKNNDVFKILERLLDAGPELNTTNEQGETVIAFIQRPVRFGVRARDMQQIEQAKTDVIDVISKRLSLSSQPKDNDEQPLATSSEKLLVPVGVPSQIGLMGGKTNNGRQPKKTGTESISHPANFYKGWGSCSIS